MQTFMGQDFDSKQQLLEHVHSEVNGMPLNEILTGANLALVAALAERKTGYGTISAARVVERAKLGTREVQVRTTDGWRPVSIKKAVELPSPRPDSARLAKVLRHAVAPDIRAWRAAEFEAGRGVCGISGVSIARPEDADVDHCGEWTFGSIKDAWILAEGGASGIALVDDAASGHRMADREQEARWVQFHNERAEFRILLRAVHRAWSHEQQAQAVAAQRKAA